MPEGESVRKTRPNVTAVRAPSGPPAAKQPKVVKARKSRARMRLRKTEMVLLEKIELSTSSLPKHGMA